MATPTSLPATFVAGDVLTAAQMNNLRGAFRILQVVEGSTTTGVSSSSTTYADTNLTATITPTSTSSKVLVLVTQAGAGKGSGSSGNALVIQLLRGATQLWEHPNILFTNSAIDFYCPPVHMSYLDSPATTSATTYKTQFKNRVAASQVFLQDSACRSSIVLLEVSA